MRPPQKPILKYFQGFHSLSKPFFVCVEPEVKISEKWRKCTHHILIAKLHQLFRIYCCILLTSNISRSCPNSQIKVTNAFIYIHVTGVQRGILIIMSCILFEIFLLHPTAWSVIAIVSCFSLLSFFLIAFKLSYLFLTIVVIQF